LTYEQESRLRVRGNGVTVISGTVAAGIENVTEFLSGRIESGSITLLPSVADVSTFEQAVRKAKPKSKNVTNVLLVPLKTPWNSSWLARANSRVSKLKILDGWIRIVFMATPETLWQVMSDAKHTEFHDVDWIDIRPWDDTFLHHWLQDNNLTADQEHRKNLTDVSGRWAFALDKFVDRSQRRRSWETRIKALKRDLDHKEQRQAWLSSLGIVSQEVTHELQSLLPLKTFDAELVEMAADEANLECAALLRRVKWSERLGLLFRSEADGMWGFNPLVARLLSAKES